MGEIAGQRSRASGAQWDVAPGFWSTIGEHTLKYAAWGDGFDEARLVDHGGGAGPSGTAERHHGRRARPRARRGLRGRAGDGSRGAAAGREAPRCVRRLPARDEEELIGACIAALAAQEGVGRDEYEVVLVLDRCTDATAQRRARRRVTRLQVIEATAPASATRAGRHGPGRAAAPAGRPDRHDRRGLDARAGLAADATRRGRARGARRSAGASRWVRTTCRRGARAPQAEDASAGARASRARRARAPPVQRRLDRR